jgi:molecular chaperone GrpE
MNEKHEELQPLAAAAADDGQAAPDAQSPAPTGTAEESLDVMRRERDEFQDLLLRKSAEFDNYRKRTERERREVGARAAMDLIVELLPLVDNLERALETAPAEPRSEAYRQGVELIHKQLLDLLARRGVTPIDPLGAEFDPHLHEAVAREHAAGRREGEIVEVFSRGYALGDRLLRPAMVKVATA